MSVRRWASLILLDLGDGLRYGYPLCCVLRFSFSSGEQARARGVAYLAGGVEAFVPCGIFHRGVAYEEACRGQA